MAGRPNWFLRRLCALLGHSYPVTASTQAGPALVCVRCRAAMEDSVPRGPWGAE